MDLRLSLILAGVLLVAGLCLWETYRRTSEPWRMRRAALRQESSIAKEQQQPSQQVCAKQQTALSPAGAPQYIIALHVIGQEDFRGPDIIAALGTLDMRPGPMRIFHRYLDAQESDQTSQPIFSLVNMLEPGHIPVEDIENFSTHGLVLFMPLPNVLDGMTAFEDMFAAARQLAEKLGGEVCDEQRNILTLQALEYMRERIREWRRRQLLTKARPPS